MKSERTNEFESFRALKAHLKGLSNVELDKLWDEADDHTSTDRTQNGIAKGVIWEEKARRALAPLDRPSTVLKDTEMPDVVGRPDYGWDK